MTIRQLAKLALQYKGTPKGEVLAAQVIAKRDPKDPDTYIEEFLYGLIMSWLEDPLYDNPKYSMIDEDDILSAVRQIQDWTSDWMDKHEKELYKIHEQALASGAETEDDFYDAFDKAINKKAFNEFAEDMGLV